MESRFCVNENPAIAAGSKIKLIISKANGRLELGHGCCRSPQTLSPAFAAVAQDAGRPKVILKPHFPLSPQLLKTRGGIKIAPKGRPGGFCVCRPCVWACAPHFPLLPQLLKAQGGIKIAPKGRPGGFCACRPCVWACAPRFPLLPQLLKAQGGRRRFCSITSRFRRSCSGRGRRGRRRCSPPRRGWASRSL